MNQSLLPGDSTPAGLAAELHDAILAVDGVAEVFPARPLWQNIAGAARSAVTGEPLPVVQVEFRGEAVDVLARIGVGTARPAPAVVRSVAAAIRDHLGPRTATVRVQLVQLRAAAAGPTAARRPARR